MLAHQQDESAGCGVDLAASEDADHEGNEEEYLDGAEDPPDYDNNDDFDDQVLTVRKRGVKR